jgi:hypothetical protein
MDVRAGRSGDLDLIVDSFNRRAELVLSSPKVRLKRPPSADPWPFEGPEPPDLAALYARSDGLELEDGTTLLPRGDLARTTAWLKQEKSLEDWPDDLVVIGERTDGVLVLDPDRAGERAGGGLLEAATDGLSTFRRVSMSVVGYLEARLDPASGGDAPPEKLAREAAEKKDRSALEAALASPFYPGSERDFAHAALSLGALLAAGGEEAAALAAFERSVKARAAAAPRGSRAREEAAAWKACSITANQAGARGLAEECSRRAADARAGA